MNRSAEQQKNIFAIIMDDAILIPFDFSSVWVQIKFRGFTTILRGFKCEPSFLCIYLMAQIKIHQYTWWFFI